MVRIYVRPPAISSEIATCLLSPRPRSATVPEPNCSVVDVRSRQMRYRSGTRLPAPKTGDNPTSNRRSEKVADEGGPQPC